jgi:hypothetical protein
MAHNNANGFLHIVAYSLTQPTARQLEKSCYNGVWSEWREVAHKGDIMTGQTRYDVTTMVNPNLIDGRAVTGSDNRSMVAMLDNTTGGLPTSDIVATVGGHFENGELQQLSWGLSNNGSSYTIKQGFIIDKANGNINALTPNGLRENGVRVYSPNNQPQGFSYSTTETLTGGTWIDGKPIYRKVIQGTTSATVGAGGASMVGTAISGFSELVSLKANVKSGSLTFADAYTDPDNFGFSVYMNGGAVFNQVWNATFTEKPITAIVEYTKGTDASEPDD